MVTQGIFLGHIVFSKGIEVDNAKIDLISNLPTPKCVKDIHSFLRMLVLNGSLLRILVPSLAPCVNSSPMTHRLSGLVSVRKRLTS